MTSLGDVPALLLGRRGDVLAWNMTGHALFAGHLAPDAPDLPGQRPNMARLVFLDAHTREQYADWPAKARAVAAGLRMSSGQYPDDPQLSDLVGELTVKSAEFAAMWARHRVKSGTEAAVYEMRHPLVGTMTVTQHTLRLERGQHVVLATTEMGSPSHAAMTLLAHTAATSAAASEARQAQPDRT